MVFVPREKKKKRQGILIEVVWQANSGSREAPAGKQWPDLRYRLGGIASSMCVLSEAVWHSRLIHSASQLPHVDFKSLICLFFFFFLSVVDGRCYLMVLCCTKNKFMNACGA